MATPQFLPQSLLLLALPALLATACSGSDVLPDAGEAPVDTGTVSMPDMGVQADAGPVEDMGVMEDAGSLLPCSPALSVTATASVLPFEAYIIAVEGGTGAYEFELETNASGAIINRLSGAYLAGETQGVTDVVVITDRGCLGEARTNLRVVPSLDVRPSSVQAPFGTAFTFEVLGGSGTFGFELAQAGSGGTLSATGDYVAGQAAGLDRVIVTDLETGQSADASIMVEDNAALQPNPPLVFAAVGETFDLGFNGGSGFVEIVNAPAYFDLIDNRTVRGLAPGRQLVDVRDRFTNQTAQMIIGVSASQQFTPLRAGDGLFASNMMSGDIDGDGMIDVVFAHPEADINFVNDGAVYVYRGTATGLSATPDQIIAGTERRAEFGRSALLYDMNGDDRPDLIAGAPRLDAAGVDVGAVFIYYAQPGGLFSPTADVQLSGRNAGDLFGWSVTACDFNNDGFVDLAAGAYNAEDRTRQTVTSNQGGIFVFLGHDRGLPAEADRELWGDLPDGTGAFVGQANLHLAPALASADVDGDGACDLVAGDHEYDQNTSANDGMIYVFPGIASNGNELGGIAREPALAFANLNPADRGGQLGRNVSAGDLDGDGRAEIIASHHAFDAGASDNWGAARVWSGRQFTGPVMDLVSATPADWEVEGNNSQDQAHFWVRIGDGDNDGINDILTGSLYDEVVGGTNTTGLIRVYSGRAGQLPETTPTIEIPGLSGDIFGATFAPLGDTNNDGSPDFAVFSQGNDDLGPDVGRIRFVSGIDNAFTELEVPGDPAGSRFGYRGAIVPDLDGDGDPEIAVGAYLEANTMLGRQAGIVQIYEGEAGGFASEPTQTLANFRRHSAFDYFGQSVSSAGDFDGDGLNDLAVVARFEDRPTTFGTDYVVDPACGGSSNNPGAVFVFSGRQRGTVSQEPTFIIYGPIAGDGLLEVDGNFDYNGDGLGDLLIGNLEFDRPGMGNTGGFLLIQGRAADATRTTVICQPDFQMLGTTANDLLGRGIAAIGDTNGDGCDDVAAGANAADPVDVNEGEIRVVFGWGGAGCPATPTMVALRSGLRLSQAGYSLAGGSIDVDGDGSDDFGVGLPILQGNGSSVGGLAIVYGSYVASLASEPAQDTTPPNTHYSMFAPNLPIAVAAGTDAGGQLGRSLALVDFGGGAKGIAAGAIFGAPGGGIGSGGARVFLYQPGVGLIPAPLAEFGGEPSRPNGQLGENVRSLRVGNNTWLSVGGWEGSGTGLDTGSYYVMDVDLP